jgi:hypothetical protein
MMIFHNRLRRKLPLLVYRELSPRAESRVVHHLSHCEACTKEAEELRRFKAVVSAAQGPQIDDRVLSDARVRLRLALGDARVPVRPVHGKAAIADLLWFRPGLVLAGAIGVLAAGLLIGRYLIPSTGSLPGLTDPLGDPRGVTLSNVHITNLGETPEDVELAFDATRSLRVRGTLNDPAIQRVIAYAIVNGGNPGVRMRAASSVLPRIHGTPDREMRAALLLAMKTDPNDGVRKAALEALLRYPPDIEIRDGLLSVLLSDENPGLRVAAIIGLDTLAARGCLANEEMRKSLEGLLQTEDNLFVRTKAESILKGTLQ